MEAEQGAAEGSGEADWLVAKLSEAGHAGNQKGIASIDICHDRQMYCVFYVTRIGNPPALRDAPPAVEGVSPAVRASRRSSSMARSIGSSR